MHATNTRRTFLTKIFKKKLLAGKLAYLRRIYRSIAILSRHGMDETQYTAIGDHPQYKTSHTNGRLSNDVGDTKRESSFTLPIAEQPFINIMYEY